VNKKSDSQEKHGEAAADVRDVGESDKVSFGNGYWMNLCIKTSFSYSTQVCLNVCNIEISVTTECSEIRKHKSI